MAVVEKAALTLAVAGALLGCGSSGEHSGAPSRETTPTLTAEEHAALALLHYDDSPPPEDPSNRVADDQAAARFGQRFRIAAGDEAAGDVVLNDLLGAKASSCGDGGQT